MDTGLTPSRRKIAALLLAAAFVLQLAIALRVPVGALIDDAVYLLLARALGHGSFVLPDGFNQPVTSFWPGTPLLWCLPVKLIEPHWAYARLPALLVSWLVLFLTWKLARKILPEVWAAVCVVLVALDPVFLLNSGVCASEMPFLAASLAAFCFLPEGDSPRAPWRLEAAVAAACLFRPEGVLLALALALAVGWREGRLRAAAFLALALLPAAAWLLRNHFVAGTTSDYWAQLSSQMVFLSDPAVQFHHVRDLIATLFGGGLFGLMGRPATAVGALAVAAAGAGALSLLRRDEDPRVMAVAVFLASVLCLHLVWWQVFERYLLPLMPLVWILILASAHGLPRAALKAAGVVLLGSTLWADASALSALPATGPQPWPETMAWLRENTAPDAKVQSIHAAEIMLWTGRPSITSFRNVQLSDHWMAKCLHNGIEFVIVEEDLSRWSHLPPTWRSEVGRLGVWAGSNRYATLVRRSPSERTLVYRLHHPHPEVYLKAWRLYGEAMSLPPGDASRRPKLREALRLEPGLECARLALSLQAF